MTTNASNAVGSLETSSAWRVPERVSFWLVQLAPFVLALAAYALALSVMRPDTTGDEPHYLIAAQSIAFDGDLDLVNDYASPERTLTAYSSFPLSPNAHASDYRDTGQLRPIRGIGMAAMLAPAVALGGLVGARLLMVLIAALVADQLFRLLRDLGFRRRYGILAWAAVALCYPMLVYSSQVYPELPGALLMLVALRVMVRWAASPVALALGSSAAALLVWLHVRFIPLSLGVIIGLVIAACRARRRGEVAPRAPGVLGAVRAAWGAAARYARVVTREWRTVTVPVAVPYLTYIALFAAVSYHLYGTVHPSAPYRVTGGVPAGSGGWSFPYEFALADVFNPAHGWIPFVPVHWLGLAALGCLVLRWRWAALACIAVPVGYELFIASLAPAPLWQFPARYLIVFIPFIAVPIALAIQSVRAARFVFAPLLAVSLVFAAAAAVDYRHLYPSSDKPRVFGAYAIADLFPVPNAIRFPTSYELFPGQFGPNTGKLEGQYAVARPGDPPDALLYGPLVSLRRGTYLATFQLAGAGGVPDWTAATVDAYSTLPDGVLARRTVKGTELEPRSMSEIELEFSNPGGGLIQTRVFYEGRGTVRAGPVRVVPAGAVGPRDFGRVPDWPKAFAWVIGTVVAGWLLVLGMRRARSSAESRADA